MSTEDTLSWEAANRTRAAVAAFVAAGCTILGAAVSGLGLRGVPSADDRTLTVVDTLRLTAQGRAIPPGKLAIQAEWLGDHATLPMLGTALFGVGTLLLFLPVAFLFRATRARRPQLPQVALVMTAVGAVAFAIGRTVTEFSRYLGAQDFTSSADRSNSAAADALGGNGVVLGQIFGQVGQLALGFGFVLIALNAMRVGLLTRFMGILGIIVGATFVLPLDQYGILRTFWLAALGVLILGQWPRGVPKAWSTGEAEPWPTQQQLREQREAAAPAPQRPEPAAAPSPAAARRRKRKRRS
jgi:xanthosine utilization system XapX-like protein